MGKIDFVVEMKKTGAVADKFDEMEAGYEDDAIGPVGGDGDLDALRNFAMWLVSDLFDAACDLPIFPVGLWLELQALIESSRVLVLVTAISFEDIWYFFP